MSKRFGVIHYKVGGTDGVSLELEKWQRALESLGHSVHLIAGDLGTAQGTLIPEVFHHREDARRLCQNTFLALQDYSNEEAYRDELYCLANIIEAKLLQVMDDEHIDYLIAENVWSVAANPSVAIALAQVMQSLNLPALAHNHDFYWERSDVVSLTCPSAIELADKYLPPRDTSVKHVVINSLAQRQLLERKGIQSSVIPNVFDFEGPGWEIDNYNRDFRQQIGLRDSDIYVLQATRIVARKGIEMAIDFVRALNQPHRRALLQERGLYDGRSFDDDSRIVLVLAGYTEDDVTEHYVKTLQQKIERSGIDALFIEDLVAGHRSTRDGTKLYSLWDTYVHADFVTYPSLWEGWGNQFLEALRARLPILLFEYPVYVADIKDMGFEAVSLGARIADRDDLNLVTIDQSLVETAADSAVDLLTIPNLRGRVVDRNFKLGQRYYSIESLSSYLEPLIKD